MNKMLQMFAVGALVACGAATAVGAPAADPVVGTWTLNSAKSKFTPGPGPKSMTRTYTEGADGVSMTIEGVAADGSKISQQSTFKYDGKDYPVTGNPDFDSLSAVKVNGSTVKSKQKKDGKIVGSATRSVSGHGKILTLTSSIKNANGVRVHSVAVFDKQ